MNNKNNKQYDPKKDYRSSMNYTTCYTPIGKGGRVVLSVGVFGLETLVHNQPDGDGMTFFSLDEARQYALNQGYLVEYDPMEEAKRLAELKNKMNKTET